MAGKSQCTGDRFIRGNRLTKLMSERHLTAEKICEVIDYEQGEGDERKKVGNTNPGTISNWKSGKYPLSDTNAAKLCEALNLNKNYFDPSEEDLLEEYNLNHNKSRDDQSTEIDNDLELANLEKLNDSELGDLTENLLKCLRYIPLYAGNDNQIVFYGHDPNISYNPFAHQQYSPLKSAITQNGLLETLNPILLFLRDDNKLKSYLNNQSDSLKQDDFIDEIIRGKKNLWDGYPEIETWDHKSRYLWEQFTNKIAPIAKSVQFDHFSVFTIAPQPLVLQLGYLFTLEIPTEIFQLHEDTLSWKWRKDGPKIDYTLERPDSKQGQAILNVSLSSNISDEKIKKVVKGEQSIWKISLEETNNIFLQTREQLFEFKTFFKETLKEITSTSSRNALHIFLSAPSAVSFEIGKELSEINNNIIIYGPNGDTEDYERCFGLPL